MASVPLTSYKTPGVYVQEIRKLPPSIAQVETAIPAFIGYTQKAERGGEDITMVPTRVESLLQYVDWFGSAKAEDIQLGINTDTVLGQDTITVVSKTEVDYKMSYALEMFYANGGGPCFIVSVGSYDDAIQASDLQDGLDSLVLEDEPTLLVFPDAVDALGSAYGPLMVNALKQCNDPKINNRFTIMDVRQESNRDNDISPSDDATAFRESIGASLDELKYGAAYYPYLKTSLVTNTTDSKVTILWHKEDGSFQTAAVDTYIGAIETARDAAIALQEANASLNTYTTIQDIVDDVVADGAIPDADKAGAIEEDLLEQGVPSDKIQEVLATGPDATDIKTFVDSTVTALTTDRDQKQTDKSNADTAETTAKAAADAALGAIAIADRADLSLLTLAEIEGEHNARYNNIISAMNEKCRLVLPPSSAMAGVYATVDNTRGVFKAPANVGVANLIEPALKISDSQHDGFNIDTRGGKSINVIRSFKGIGNLVWGARTLAGNDREWKYISVRRFFNMVEESTKRALFNFVFEANNRNTWISVRAAIESFLETQWRAGALLGNTPNDAFFVRVGMPETFTEAEMLDGFMVVEIGMAVVRPAEFIVLKFMHKFELGQS